MAYYDLNRRFVERESYDQDELVAAQMRGKQVAWAKVLKNRSSVIVAAANFGKTTEMRQQAAQLRAHGETAVFVALRQLADRGSLDKALTGAVNRPGFRGGSNSGEWSHEEVPEVFARGA